MPLPSTREREVYEILRTYADSHDFRTFFERCIRPVIADWRDDLCRNLALTEGKRLGLQHALLALEEGFASIFKQAGLEVPEWLAKEFKFKDE